MRFTRENAPGALYGEWAKKEECWIKVKDQEFGLELSFIDKDLKGEEGDSGRTADHNTDSLLRQEKLKEIKEVGADNWKTIYLWCKNNDSFPLFYTNLAHTISRKIRGSVTLSTKEIYGGSMLLEEIAKKSSLLQDIYEKQNLRDKNGEIQSA